MRNRIKVIRAELNLTQQDLSDKIGISRVALNRIENEQTTPNGETIAKLVRVLGKPANEIFFDLDVVCKQRKGD